MDIEQQQQVDDLSQWFSTYGFITAERILGRYQISLPHDCLLAAIKNADSFYHRILQIPIKNVLNGIVFEQAHDYHIYVQKLFIDYLLSGEPSSPEGSPGASTRERIEDERKQLLELGQNFQDLRMEHEALIANSQKMLINSTKQWNTDLENLIKTAQSALKSKKAEIKPSAIRHAIYLALSENSLNTAGFVESIKIPHIQEHKTAIENKLQPLLAIATEFEPQYHEYYQRTEVIKDQARSFRTQFYDTILRVLELIKNLPSYRIDPIQDAINREPLYFDKNLGD